MNRNMVIDLNNIIGVRDSSQNIIERIYNSNSQIIWELDSHHEYPDDDYKNQYFTITPDKTFFNLYPQNEWRIEIFTKGAPETYYRIDKGGWTQAALNTSIHFIGWHEIQIKCNAVWEYNDYPIGSLSDFSDKINSILVKNGINSIDITYSVSGNIQSLIYGDSFRSKEDALDYAFGNIFGGQSNLISAENLILPSGKIGYRSFEGMFYHCSNLSKAPGLSSISLSGYCYHIMFEDCSSLIKAPLLPATYIPIGAYDYMFNGCSKIKYIECYALRNETGYYINNWLQATDDNGTMVVKMPVDKWNQLGDDETRRKYYSWLSIPESWELINIVD